MGFRRVSRRRSSTRSFRSIALLIAASLIAGGLGIAPRSATADEQIQCPYDRHEIEACDPFGWGHFLGSVAIENLDDRGDEGVRVRGGDRLRVSVTQTHIGPHWVNTSTHWQESGVPGATIEISDSPVRRILDWGPQEGENVDVTTAARSVTWEGIEHVITPYCGHCAGQNGPPPSELPTSMFPMGQEFWAIFEMEEADTAGFGFANGEVHTRGGLVIYSDFGHRRYNHDVTPFYVEKTADTDRPEYVKPGEEFTYTIFVKSEIDEESTLTIEDKPPPEVVGSIVPDSFSEPPESNEDGVLTWTFPDFGFEDKTITYGFKVADPVPEDWEHVQSVVEATNERGNFSRYESELTVSRRIPIRGAVKDIYLHWPESHRVATDRTLSGATVRLLDSDDREVDRTTSDGDGSYELKTDGPDTYKVEATTRADLYRDGMEEVIHDGQDAKDYAEIEVTDEDRGPLEKNVHVGKSLIDRTAKQMHTLSHLDSTYPFAFFPEGTPALPGLPPLPVNHSIGQFVSSYCVYFEALCGAEDAFAYDTAAMEHLVEVARDPANQNYHVEFKKPYRGTGDKDYWNALIRGSMFMDMLAKRHIEAGKFADLAAKFITAVMVAEISKVVAKKYLKFGSRADVVKIMNAAKVGTLAVIVNIVVPFVVSKLGGGSDQIEVIAKQIRYAYDLMISEMGGTQLLADGFFEAVFIPVRAGMVAVYMSQYTDYAQRVGLDPVATQLAVRGYSGDTSEAMSQLSRYDTVITGRTRDALSTIGWVTKINSMIRGADGIIGILGPKVSEAPLPGSSRWRDLLSQVSKMDTENAKNYKTVLDANGKDVKTGRALGLNGADAAMAVTAATVFTVVFSDALVRSLEILDLATSATNPTDTTGPGSAVARASPATTAHVASTTRRAPSGPSPQFQTWLTLFDDIAAAIRSDDPDEVDQKITELIPAHEALFSRWRSLSFQGQASLAADESPAPRQQLFSAALAVAAEATTSVVRYVDAWLESDDRTTNQAFRAALERLREVAPKVDKQAQQLEALISDVTVPAQAIIDLTAEPSDAALVNGESVDVVFRVTNIGGAALGATVLRIASITGFEVLEGDASSVPAIAAGGYHDIPARIRSVGADGGEFYGTLEVRLVGMDDSIIATFGTPFIVLPGAA